MNIVIFNDQETFFKGKSLNAPFSEKSIKEKSVDLFDDEDPCIIHKSYVVKTLAKQIEDALDEASGEPLNVKDHPEIQSTLALDAEGLKIRKEDG